MRKFIAVVLVEAALLCAAIFLNMLTTIAPIWIWPTVSVVCLVLAALLYTAEIKRWVSRFFRKGPQRIEAETKFKAVEMTVSVGKRRNKKLFVLLTLRRLLGKLLPW